MATNFMNLILPVVTVTLGPEWATEINVAIESIDEHDHSSGKGKSIPTSALNINANLDYNSHNAYNLLQVKLISNDATLSGASNINSIYTTLGDLYYTNSAGVAIQITSGGSITVPGGSAVNSFEQLEIATDFTIAPSLTAVYLLVDSTATRTITLPLASAVTGGRFYIIKDVSGESNTNNITIQTAGSDLIDGSSTYIYNSNFGSFWLTGNGEESWSIS